jgi:hypothetical protein
MNGLVLLPDVFDNVANAAQWYDEKGGPAWVIGAWPVSTPRNCCQSIAVFFRVGLPSDCLGRQDVFWIETRNALVSVLAFKLK